VVLFHFVVLRAVFVFFFQAEDGIRDRNVTGVQTCALPIFVMKALQMLAEQLTVGRKEYLAAFSVFSRIYLRIRERLATCLQQTPILVQAVKRLQMTIEHSLG